MSSKINVQKIYRDKLERKTQRLESLQKLGKWWWWIWIMMKLSNLPYSNQFFTHLAGLPLGIYRSKIPLKQFKPYISPKAQISCRNLQVGSGCFIDDFVTIYGGQAGGSVILDKEVRIYRGTIIEVEQGGNIIIGKYSSIQPNCNLLGYVGDVQIGSKVMIGPQCGFTPYQHTTNDLSQPMSDLGLISKGNIVIEDDVWLGMGVKVMDGVRIGQGSVIGANAVVTKDIPPYSIAIGVPARVIRKRTDQL